MSATDADGVTISKGDTVESIWTERRGLVDWVGVEFVGVRWPNGLGKLERQAVVNRAAALRVVDQSTR